MFHGRVYKKAEKVVQKRLLDSRLCGLLEASSGADGQSYEINTHADFEQVLDVSFVVTEMIVGTVTTMRLLCTQVFASHRITTARVFSGILNNIDAGS